MFIFYIQIYVEKWEFLSLAWILKSNGKHFLVNCKTVNIFELSSQKFPTTTDDIFLRHFLSIDNWTTNCVLRLHQDGYRRFYFNYA